MKFRTLSLALLAAAGCTDPTFEPTPDAAGGPIEVAPYTLHVDNDAVHWVDGVVHYATTAAFANNPDLMAALESTKAFYASVSSIRFEPDQTLLVDFSKPGIVYSVSSRSSETTCPGGITTRRNLGTGDESGANVWAGANIAMCGGNPAIALPASGRTTLIHETGHALGMSHEQTRPDRNKTVICHPENMDKLDPNMCGPDASHPGDIVGTWQQCFDDPCNHSLQFAPLTGPVTVYGPYDLASTMEYPSGFFVKPGGGATLTAKGSGSCTIGSGSAVTGACLGAQNDLSDGDVTTLRQLYQEPLDTLTGTAEFGAAIAVGDFDGDGFDDVAVGAPGAVGDDGKTEGAVYIYKGTAGRRQVTGNTVAPTDWTTNLVAWRVLRPSDFGNTGQTGERFGAALKAQDLSGHKLATGDDSVDLAIGAPGRDGGTGAIYVGYGHTYTLHNDGVYGTAKATFGLQTIGTGKQPVYYPESAFVTATKNDQFGASLGAARFDAATMNELAIGAPGAQQVVLTTHAGGTAVALSLFKKLTPPSAAADFGRTIATGTLDTDTVADVIVGAPLSDITAGRVFAFTSLAGFTNPASTLAPGSAIADRFGTAVAAGHYFTTGNQIAVGATGRASGTGRVFVYTWSSGGFGTPQTIGESIDSNQQGAPGDNFGAALRTAKLVGSGQDDLVVGAPGKTGGGAVFVLTSANGTAITDGAMHTPPSTMPGTGFGGAVSTGDLDGDDNLELIVGGTGESPANSPGGAITALHGSDSGVTGQKLWRFPAFKLEQK